MSVRAHNLVADVLLNLDPFGRAAKSLAVERGQAERAIEALVPTILDQLARNADAPEGVSRLVEVTGRHGAGQDARLLEQLIGGATADALVSEVAGFSGVGLSESRALAKLTALAVLDVLAEVKQSEGLDIAGLANVLAAQKHSITRAIPVDFGTDLSDNTPFVSQHEVPEVRTRAAANAASSRLADSIKPIVVGAVTSRLEAARSPAPIAVDRLPPDLPVPRETDDGAISQIRDAIAPRKPAAASTRSYAEPSGAGISPWLIPLILLGLVTMGWLYDVFLRRDQPIVIAETNRGERPVAVVRPEAPIPLEDPTARAQEQARLAMVQAETKAKAKAELEARQKADAEARRKAEAEADARRRAEAELDARRRADAEAAAKSKAEAEARLRAEATAAKARAEAEEEAARVRAEAEARQRSEAEARRRAEAEAAAAAMRAQEETRRRTALRACQDTVAIVAGAGLIRFQTAKALLTRESSPTLTRIADAIKSCPMVKVRVEGHTDSDGNAASNQALSERRARTVAAYLMRLGVGEAQLHPIGYGETRPLASNQTEWNRALNRRIEFVVETN